MNDNEIELIKEDLLSQKFGNDDDKKKIIKEVSYDNLGIIQFFIEEISNINTLSNKDLH